MTTHSNIEPPERKCSYCTRTKTYAWFGEKKGSLHCQSCHNRRAGHPSLKCIDCGRTETCCWHNVSQGNHQCDTCYRKIRQAKKKALLAKGPASTAKSAERVQVTPISQAHLPPQSPLLSEPPTTSEPGHVTHSVPLSHDEDSLHSLSSLPTSLRTRTGTNLVHSSGFTQTYQTQSPSSSMLPSPSLTSVDMSPSPNPRKRPANSFLQSAEEIVVENDRLKDEVKTLKGALEEKTIEVSCLEHDSKVQKDGLKVLDDKNKTLRLRAEDSERKTDIFIKQAKSQENEAHELRTQLNEAFATINIRDNEIKRLKDQLSCRKVDQSEMMTEGEHMQKELSEIKSRRTAVDRKNQILKAEISSLKQRVASGKPTQTPNNTKPSMKLNKAALVELGQKQAAEIAALRNDSQNEAKRFSEKLQALYAEKEKEYVETIKSQRVRLAQYFEDSQYKLGLDERNARSQAIKDNDANNLAKARAIVSKISKMGVVELGKLVARIPDLEMMDTTQRWDEKNGFWTQLEKELERIFQGEE